mgnify:CR=1 FL=1
MDAIRTLLKNRHWLCEHCFGLHSFTSELAGGERSRRWGKHRRKCWQWNAEVADEAPTAIKIPSSPSYMPVDVVHYKKLVDDCHIGDIYMDMGARSLFIAYAAMNGSRVTGSGTL